ncbi:hypothetical protein M427DRAFT_100421, partial [Gonapodya prolifera JEL478]
MAAPRPRSQRSISIHSPTGSNPTLSPTPTVTPGVSAGHADSTCDGAAQLHKVVLAPVSTFATGTGGASRALLPPITAPYRFGHVEEDLYRGGYPKSRNLRFLRRLRLRTLVSLTPDPPNDELLEFCREEKIESIHVPVPRPKGSFPLTYAKATSILQLLIDASRLPLFVHCLDGVLVTGAAIMCLRKLQMWT